MSGQNFVLAYMQACTGGKLPVAECSPMWQLVIIGVFLVVAVVTLLILHLRPKAQMQ